MASNEIILKLLDLGLCPRCIIQFLNPGDIFDDESDDGLLKLINNYIRETNSQFQSYSLSVFCPCCLGAFTENNIDVALQEITSKIACSKYQRNLCINVTANICPIIDVCRTTIRTIVTQNNTKTFHFPTANCVLESLIQARLKSLGYHINSPENAKILVTLSCEASHQYDLCNMMAPTSTVTLKKKRKIGALLGLTGSSSHTDVDVDEFAVSNDVPAHCSISRIECDTILGQLKQQSIEQWNDTRQNIKSYAQRCQVMNMQLSWTAAIGSPSLFLLGRYLKFARDVPQAAWTTDGKRKGRNSVEEIISEQVKFILDADAVKMHACGREDIDVRCLGNGRPFVLEIINSGNNCTKERLSTIMENINNRHGLNCEGDVVVSMLQTTTKDTWSSMQAVAEEKRKAYRCVVWTSDPVTSDKLEQLQAHFEQPSSSSSSSLSKPNEEEQVLKISQKTPLRVLHRRSLIDRPRDIYYLSTICVNSHFFILDLITSAGTYVKEFVHGDLGRSVPSIGSMLGCEADILQLDVIYLFDEYEGGGTIADFIQMKQLREASDLQTQWSSGMKPAGNQEMMSLHQLQQNKHLCYSK